MLRTRPAPLSLSRIWVRNVSGMPCDSAISRIGTGQSSWRFWARAITARQAYSAFAEILTASSSAGLQSVPGGSEKLLEEGGFERGSSLLVRQPVNGHPGFGFGIPASKHVEPTGSDRQAGAIATSAREDSKPARSLIRPKGMALKPGREREIGPTSESLPFLSSLSRQNLDYSDPLFEKSRKPR